MRDKYYKKKYLKLVRNGKTLQYKFIKSKKYKSEIIQLWKKMYGDKFYLCSIVEEIINPKIKKYMKDNPIQKMRNFLYENMKSLDANVQEDATDILNEIQILLNEKDDKIEDAYEEFELCKNEKQSIEYELESFKQNYKEIDFGVGSVLFHVTDESSLSVQEIFANLQNISNIVPVNVIADSLKRLQR